METEQYIKKSVHYANKGLHHFLVPLGDLIVRAYIAVIFFKSGLTKIENWDSTKTLFAEEYMVPFLHNEVAAFITTFVELVMPVLLLLGLGGRFPAFVLFVFNICAVLFYPFLFTPEGAVGLDNHIYWGLVLGLLMLHGPGKFSLDQLIHDWRYKK